MASATPIIDHDQIRRWVEKNDGRPAAVKGTGEKGSPGVLRIDFGEKEDSLEEISWEEWFGAFDENGLALLVDEDSRFNKLINREH